MSTSMSDSPYLSLPPLFVFLSLSLSLRLCLSFVLSLPRVSIQTGFQPEVYNMSHKSYPISCRADFLQVDISESGAQRVQG